MNESSESGSSLTDLLPPEIVNIIKRKSSRDPNSRFPRKLHLLMAHLARDPLLENKIGLNWISETEFRMKKKNVAQVMGIKLNTMNVNLRDLGFEQLQHDKNGWTEWRREGFNRSATIEVANEILKDESARNNYELANPSKSMKSVVCNVQLPVDLIVGKVGPAESAAFIKVVRDLWTSISGNKPELPYDVFINKAAECFKQPEQPYENTIEVISAIITQPHGLVNQSHLFRFLAMFGPDKTAMLKIASLLMCSNNNGNWLTFVDPPPILGGTMTGYFDKQMPNCLILRYPDDSVKRVWNNPMIDAFGNYLIDDNNLRFNSWDKYFEPRYPNNFMFQ